MSVNGDANTGPMRLGTAIVDMGTGSIRRSAS